MSTPTRQHDWYRPYSYSTLAMVEVCRVCLFGRRGNDLTPCAGPIDRSAPTPQPRAIPLPSANPETYGYVPAFAHSLRDGEQA